MRTTTTLVVLVNVCNILQTSATDPSNQSNLICGQKGWDAGTESFASYIYMPSYSLCKDFCNQYGKGRLSFAYVASENGTNGGHCELYRDSLKNNFIADETSPYKFYDQACDAGDQYCKVNGYPTVDSWQSSEMNDVVSCGKQCHDLYSHCQSFAYGNGECFFFHDTVGGILMFNLSSPFTFWDRTCNSNPYATGSSTTVLSKTTSKVATSTKSTAASGFITTTMKTQSSSGSTKISTIKATATTPFTTSRAKTSTVRTTAISAISTTDTTNGIDTIPMENSSSISSDATTTGTNLSATATTLTTSTEDRIVTAACYQRLA